MRQGKLLTTGFWAIPHPIALIVHLVNLRRRERVVVDTRIVDLAVEVIGRIHRGNVESTNADFPSGINTRRGGRRNRISHSISVNVGCRAIERAHNMMPLSIIE